MLQKAILLLQREQEVRLPKSIFPMEDTVDKMMGLYHQEMSLK
jgi:hypothetical protein